MKMCVCVCSSLLEFLLVIEHFVCECFNECVCIHVRELRFLCKECTFVLFQRNEYRAMVCVYYRLFLFSHVHVLLFSFHYRCRKKKKKKTINICINCITSIFSYLFYLICRVINRDDFRLL